MPGILTICPIKREDQLDCPLTVPPLRGVSHLVPGWLDVAPSAPAKESSHYGGSEGTARGRGWG